MLDKTDSPENSRGTDKNIYEADIRNRVKHAKLESTPKFEKNLWKTHAYTYTTETKHFIFPGCQTHGMESPTQFIYRC